MTLEDEGRYQVNNKDCHQLYSSERDENIIAVLGPTNTGKTHYAMERMLSYNSGIIGCPLRLLAREIYEKLIKVKGISKVALVTGEESMIPPMAMYYVCTVEAMPKDLCVEFLAIDEVQLSTHNERGHIFTDRILNARGMIETMFLGSYNLSKLLKIIIPNIKIIKMKRFSNLSYSGKLKISKIPRRSAIVAFSINDVYEIAEFVKRRHGGTAVVLGALSPKTRNAQMDLYESGEVDYLVATDAIGMGLNMDINHVAFTKIRKFDGKTTRNLSYSETAQIAGRAGRFKADGTFGETAGCIPFTEEMIRAIEGHNFTDIYTLKWRNSDLDFSSIKNLISSLVKFSKKPYLIPSQESDDEKALRYLLKRIEIRNRSLCPDAIKKLWDVCCIPDYQKNYDDSHFSVLEQIYCYLIDVGHIPENWINTQLEYLDNMSGEIDLLGIRLSSVRMWNYISNRSNWVDQRSGIKERAKEIENKLSDALHLSLINRFVGLKTARMIKKLRDNEGFAADIKGNDVFIEGHYVGRLEGLSFINEISKNLKDANLVFKIVRIALSKEIKNRVNDIKFSHDENFSFNKKYNICWNSNIIALLGKGLSIYKPRIRLKNKQYLNSKQVAMVEERITSFVYKKIDNLNGLLSKNLKIFPNGAANGLIYQLSESSGCLLISDVKTLLENIRKEERRKLNKIGIRIGEICIWVPNFIRYGRPELGWVLSQKFYNIRPLLAFPCKNKPNNVGNIPKAVFNAGGFIIINDYAYFTEYLEQLACYIKKIMRNKNRISLSNKNIKIICNNFSLSNIQFFSILKNLGYIRKSNKSNRYILDKIKKNKTGLSKEKLLFSPFRVLYKNLR